MFQAVVIRLVAGPIARLDSDVAAVPELHPSLVNTTSRPLGVGATTRCVKHVAVDILILLLFVRVLAGASGRRSRT